MVQKFGIKFGGLQQKILNLVLIFILAIVGVFAAVSVYQGRHLSEIVSEAGEKQQKSIKSVSQETMNYIVHSSLAKNTAMQAYMADNTFSEVKANVATLQTVTQRIFEHSELFPDKEVPLPDAANDGTPAIQYAAKAGFDPSQSKSLGLIGNLSDMMIAMYSNSDKLSSCFIGTPEGVAVFVNDRSSAYVDENGDPVTFDPTERPWYKEAVEKGDICFTGIELDAYTDIKGLVCAAPIYVDGELVAVVGADVFLNDIDEYVNNSGAEGDFVFVVNDSGNIIFSPKTEGTLAVQLSDDANDLRESQNTEFADFISSSLEKNTATQLVTVDGVEYYMAGAPMGTVGWTVVSAVEKSLTEATTNQMLDQYDEINKDATEKFEKGAKASERTTLVLTVLLLILASAAALSLAGRIVKPIEKMTKRIADIKEGETFQMEDIYRTKDEIELLAQAFELISAKTKQYIIDITKITKEKERIGTELELARNIQADMLPNIFPPFPDKPDFDIYASMSPAKEVGGDFYDFFLVDDDHLAMVMADVSGKGVPAALFMMMSKILINNFAMMGGSPKEVLEKTNEMICQNNEEEMFVTVWFGILEISTGKITAANAGHEYPIVKQPDGKFELFKDKHGFVIGGMNGMRYKEYEFEIKKGGKLFLYTDGVPEATNANNELFGTDRMLEVLNKDPEIQPAQMLGEMRKAVDEFVGEAPQFDDLTMLGLELK